nr:MULTISPECIES: GNAT family N-acetyltransferase [unclassified Pseudomonas]
MTVVQALSYKDLAWPSDILSIPWTRLASCLLAVRPGQNVKGNVLGSKNMENKEPRYPIPAILLSRLAVDRTAQKQGLGKRLMADFFRRVCVVARHSGVAFIVVDAKDMDAASYYHSKLGFVPSSNNPLRLVLPTATLLKTV